MNSTSLRRILWHTRTGQGIQIIFLLLSGISSFASVFEIKSDYQDSVSVTQPCPGMPPLEHVNHHKWELPTASAHWMFALF